MQQYFMAFLLLSIVSLGVSSPANAGKLDSIRGKVSSFDFSPEQREETECRDDEQEASRDKERRRHSYSNESSRRRRSGSSGKLDDIRVASTGLRHRGARQPSARHRHYPARSPFGLHLGISSFAPATIVEQHHYYVPTETVHVMPVEPGVIYSEQPYIVPDTYQAPVMPSDSSVVATHPSSEVILSEPDVTAWNPPFQLRFEIDYAGDEADVNRAGFGLLANVTGGFGIEAGARKFWERDGDDRDHMWIGDFNIVHELLPTRYVRTRAGVGFNWLSDSWGGEAGLNLTLGTELFAGPIVFSGEADLGTIGDAELFHGRLTASIRRGDHMDWFAGYDFLAIGGVEVRGVVAGIRFRF